MNKPATEKQINILRGMNLQAPLTQDEVQTLFNHIDALEYLLDEYEVHDVFGTGGWRHAIGLE